MSELIDFYHLHGTKVLGTLQAIIAGLLTIPNLFPPTAVPYVTAVSVVLGVLTVRRGFTNTAATR